MRLTKLTLLLLLLSAALLGQNPLTPVWPTAIIDDEDFPLISNVTQTTLSSGINDTTLTLPVADSSTGFRFPTLVVIDSETIKICGQTGGTQLDACTGGRGILSTAVSHSAAANVTVAIVDYYWLRTQAEIKSLETQLGVSLGNVGDPPTGSDGDVQMVDGSAAHKVFSGFNYNGQALSLPPSTTVPATEGGQITLTGDTTNNVDFFLDVAVGTGRFWTNDAADRTFSVFNLGAGELNLNLDGDLDVASATLVSNLGIEFTASDTNPTCDVGDYDIYADLSETTLKKCLNGVVSDLDTGGGGGITTLNTLTASTQTLADVDDTNVTLAISSVTSTHTFTLGWTGTLADSRVADDITLTNITQITNRAISNTTGDLAASRVDDGAAAATFALFSGAGGAASFRAIVEADVSDLGSYLPLSGGTLTGALIADNLGIEYVDSDINPTCGAGEYKIYADLSEAVLKKCQNTVVTDLDTGGAGGDSISVIGVSATDANFIAGTNITPVLDTGPTPDTVTMNLIDGSLVLDTVVADAYVSETSTGILTVVGPHSTRVGNANYNTAASGTINVVGGTETSCTARIFVDTAGNLEALLSTAQCVTDATCSAAFNSCTEGTAFPTDTARHIATWTLAGAGDWSNTGTLHQSHGSDPAIGGDGINVTLSGGIRTVAVDASVIRNDDNNAFGAFYQDIAQIAVPANPASGTRRIFVDSADGVLKVRTSGGTTVSLESGGADGVGYDQIADEDSNLTKRARVNFTGAGVSCVDDAVDSTDCTISGGGSGITLEEADGTPTMTATTVQFDQADGFTVTDETAGVGQVDFVLANVTTSTLDEARLDVNVVLDNAANTWSTGAQSFAAATSLTVPVAAGAAPTANGTVAYDSTANQLEYGDATVNRIVVNTDEAQTLAAKTLTTPTIGDLSNATHDHSNAAGGGQFAITNTTGDLPLSTRTSGNYVLDVTCGTGMTGCVAAAEGATEAIAFDFSDAGADPALGAEECRFSNEGASDGGWVCEGTANTIETRFRVTPATTSDKIVTFPDATGEVSLLGQTVESGEADATFVLDTESPAAADIAGTFAAGLTHVADSVGTTPLDDGADTPLSGEYVRVDTVDQAGFEYRTTAEVLSDIGGESETHASEHQNGGADEVATATPAANAIPKAEADGDLANGWIGLDQSYVWTGPHDFGGTIIEIQNGTAAPLLGDCDADAERGRIYQKTDATSGQQLYLCEGAANGWVVQGDGGGAGGDSMEVEDGDNLGTFTAIVTTGRFEDSGDINFVNTSNDISGLIRASAVGDAEMDNAAHHHTIDGGNPMTGNWEFTSAIRFPNNNTPPAADCNQSFESFRMMHDADANAWETLQVCRGVSGWYTYRGFDLAQAHVMTSGGSIDMGGADSFEVPNAAAPTTDAFGEIAGDNDAWAASRGAPQWFDGTANTYLIGVLATDTPTNGQVPKWQTGGTILWEDDTSGGTPSLDTVSDPVAAKTFSFDVAETLVFDQTGAMGAINAFQFTQTSATATAGTILDVRNVDPDVDAFRAGNGTNGVAVDGAGLLTAEGTGGIQATDLVAASSVVSNAEVDDDITLTNITQVTNRDIDDISGQTAWGSAATKDTADLTISGVEVDFHNGGSPGYPLLSGNATPPVGACDAAAEYGRIMFDTNLDTEGSVVVCTSAGWKDIDDDGGAGGFTSFDVQGDDGAPNTVITDGNTLIVSGGTNISTEDGDAGADTLAINLDLTGITNGQFLYDNADALGAISQISYDGTDLTIDVTDGDVVESNRQVIPVYNDTGATLFECAAVYNTGVLDAPSGLPEVAIADNDGAGTMAAIGLVESDIAAASIGYVVTGGEFINIDTTSTETWSTGDEVYINASGTNTTQECDDTLTKTKPTGASNLIQKIGEVGRVNASAGSIHIGGALRTNDVPNTIVIGTDDTINTDSVTLDNTWAAAQLESGVVVDSESPNAAGDIAGDFATGLTYDANSVNEDELAATITFAAGDNIVLPIEAADQTTDGEIDYDSAEEVLEIGDDGSGTHKFYPGSRTDGAADLDASGDLVANTETGDTALTIPSYITIPVAACLTDTTAGATVSLPTTAPAAATCVKTAGGQLLGLLGFDTAADEFMQYSFRLPPGWTGNVDISATYRAPTLTTGTVQWATQTACSADTEADSQTWNAADTFAADTVNGTAATWNVVTDTNITMTGCAADEMFYLRFFRDISGDTLAEDAQLKEVRLTLRNTF